MKTADAFMILGLVFVTVLTGSDVTAADRSICNYDSDISLYHSGALQSCRLKDDYSYNDIRCKSDAQISFYENGNVESCTLSDDTTIAGYKCKGDTPAYFYSDGKLRSCVYPD